MVTAEEPRAVVPVIVPVIVPVETTTEVKFEVLPAEPSQPVVSATLAVVSPPVADSMRSAPSTQDRELTAPAWLPSQEDVLPSPSHQSETAALSGITERRSRRSHREKVTGNHLLRAAKYTFLISLLAAAGTARDWGDPLAKRLENMFSAVFTNESAYELHRDAPPPPNIDAVLQAERIEEQRREVLTTAVDVSKSHLEVAPRFIWDEATTVFSLGFPQIEIFYLNQAQQRGLPMPKRYCTYVEKFFGLRISDLQRLTSVQADSDKPGIVVVTTQRDANPSTWISEANLQEEASESLGSSQLLRYQGPEGHICGVVAVDQRNFAIGDPELLRACLQRRGDLKTNASVNALWPDFLRKQPGAFLWTVKLDAGLEEQLKKADKVAGLDTISSFAVRFGGEPPLCECFAIRDSKSSQEAFANAATGSLRGMLQMMTTQIESGGAQRSSAREAPTVEVSKTAATAQVRRGEEFVNIFLQGFYAPITNDPSPLPSLAQARTLAHAFNLARGFDAPEARRVRTVEQALEALQRGMSGNGRAAAMEFQVQEMNADELHRIRRYLTFADGYLACRPDLESLPDSIRALAEEGRDRLNAETVLSLCATPATDKVVKLKDLAGYIRKTLADLKAKRGAMALFGMPQLTDEEITGVLRYIQQQPNGKLGWKPGQLSYNAWQAKSNPKAIRDAATLASLASAAQAAGARDLAQAATVEKAIEILCQGIKGEGQFVTATFKCQNLTAQELQAAAGLLELDQGLLKLKSEVEQ